MVKIYTTMLTNQSMNTKTILLFWLTCIYTTSSLSGQIYLHDQDITSQINSYLHKMNLDGINLVLTSSHTTQHNGVTHVYLQQYHKGLPIIGAVANLVIKEDVRIGHSVALIPTITGQHAQVNLHPDQVITSVAKHLNMPFFKSRPHIQQIDETQFQLTHLPYAKDNVLLNHVWYPSTDGSLKKVWQVTFQSNLGSEDFDVLVDGQTGQILRVLNHTVSCNFMTPPQSPLPVSIQSSNAVEITPHPQPKTYNTDAAGSYRVFAPPLESPLAGARSLVVSPANDNASPFGWHDTNGVPGAEYAITRGNNVHAYQDINSNNASSNDEPSGGAGLLFDFPFERDSTPIFNLDADITNLFFWSNFIHDWIYPFGFNENAGNFQQNNYGKGGEAGDAVLAETLDGSDVGNANFNAPIDGAPGRMQMYRWIVGGELSINLPSTIEGNVRTGAANFGMNPVDINQANVVQVHDGIGVSEDLCQEIINSDDLVGNIALIDRGLCDFSFKVYSAQMSGAIACIVCNNLDNAPLVSMKGGANAEMVTIPSLFISKEDCQRIKDVLNDNRDVKVSISKSKELSSSFDNGIVAHEYAHGISLRLVGGKNNSSCLTNDEQVGEGWSDFIALVLTQQPGDKAAKARSIGSYAVDETPNGPGIRRYPYSTDMTINPQTHSHIRTSMSPHPVGEIWVAALWDMYWLFIDQHGYDPTWQDRSSGNYIAMQIIIDAMKIQPCDAGILQARDAILTADAINNLGNNECLIWQAFARRGMGVDAFGGNSNWRYDNIDGFEVPLSCRQGLTIERQATPTISVGQEIRVDISIYNNIEPLNNVIIRDYVPDLTQSGMRFGTLLSDNVEVQINNEEVDFLIPSLPFQKTTRISYTLKTDGLSPAEFTFYDNFEGQPKFSFDRTSSDVSHWTISDSLQRGGKFSLWAPGDLFEGDRYATFKQPISINPNQILRFDHIYDTQLGFDGGIVEVSTDNGNTWQPIDPNDLLLAPYRDKIAYDFFLRNTQSAYTGLDSVWRTSIVDLSRYSGSDLLIRFLSKQQDFLEIEPYKGWYIDNVEITDRKEITGSTCVISEQTEMGCAVSSTFINTSAQTTPVHDISIDPSDFYLSPNPAIDLLSIHLNWLNDSAANIQILSVDGRIVLSYDQYLRAGTNSWNQDISTLIPGLYILKIQTPEGILNQQFVKQ